MGLAEVQAKQHIVVASILNLESAHACLFQIESLTKDLEQEKELGRVAEGVAQDEMNKRLDAERLRAAAERDLSRLRADSEVEMSDVRTLLPIAQSP